MATILRTWSYQYQWLYDSISRLAALSVGGEKRFRNLAWQGLDLTTDMNILDLCCGSGQSTQFLVQYSQHVTGLDISPLSLGRAARNVPQADYLEGLAEQIPCEDNQFDLVHTSAALHEMTPEQREQILAQVYRVLKPGGFFVLIDLHRPTNSLFWPGLAVFMWLFETETAWEMLSVDLGAKIEQVGLKMITQKLYAGGTLQVIQAQKLA